MGCKCKDRKDISEEYKKKRENYSYYHHWTPMSNGHIICSKCNLIQTKESLKKPCIKIKGSKF